MTTAGQARRRRSGFLLFLAVVVFFVVFVIWADHAEIDQVARGPAEVVPAQEIQSISHLEGGILENLHVREGETVRTGEVIARIKNTRTRADYEAAVTRQNALNARLERLNAELNGRKPEFPVKMKADAPQLVAAQTRVANLRHAALGARLEALDLKYAQTQKELEVQRAKGEHLRDQLDLARQETAILDPLVEEGSAARTDLIQIRKTISDIRSQIDNVEGAIPKTKSKLQEVANERDQARAEFRSKAFERLNETRNQLTKVKQQITAGGQRIERTELKAPMDGVVQSVAIPTIGGVVEPGETILEIVPITEELLVEARIKPEDVAFIHPDQKANVKISAYDYSIYGGLQGKVESISADTIVDKKTDRRYYRVTVRTDSNAIEHKGREYPIRPGMTGTVDILTGQKTVLEIALDPLKKLAERALRER